MDILIILMIMVITVGFLGYVAYLVVMKILLNFRKFKKDNDYVYFRQMLIKIDSIKLMRIYYHEESDDYKLTIDIGTKEIVFSYDEESEALEGHGELLNQIYR